MPLKEANGNMYSGFVTHTINFIKGACYHDCSYCYCKKYLKEGQRLPPLRLDEKELKSNLGKGNKIFTGSGTDIFAQDVPSRWIIDSLLTCNSFMENDYIFQTKNPKRLYAEFMEYLPYWNSTVGTTIESNNDYPDIMRNSPPVQERALYLRQIKNLHPDRLKTFITIEPILKFDFGQFVTMLYGAKPDFINIGADSGGHKMPEPTKEEVISLISELKKFTQVNIKPNLNRLLK